MLASVYEQQIYQISAKAKRYQSVPLKTPPPEKHRLQSAVRNERKFDSSLGLTDFWLRGV